MDVSEIRPGASAQIPVRNPNLQSGLPDGVSELVGARKAKPGVQTPIINNENLIDACTNYIEGSGDLASCLDAAVHFILEFYLLDPERKDRLLAWSRGAGLAKFIDESMDSSIKLFSHDAELRPNMPTREEVASVLGLKRYREGLAFHIINWAATEEPLAKVIPINRG